VRTDGKNDSEMRLLAHESRRHDKVDREEMKRKKDRKKA